MRMIKQKSKELLRRIFPLSLRMQLCLLINRQKWLRPDDQYWWTMELLRDFAIKDTSNYHRFLWANHLAYAESYQTEKRFGEENMKESRKMFFSDLKKHIVNLGIDPYTGIHSVLEVGCSLGYQLRYLETNLFKKALELDGIDIDGLAITEGSGHLKLLGSKVKLICEDMGNLHLFLKDRIYDIIICTGVLMYLEKAEAVHVVEEMLKHCRIMLALSGPADPASDNCNLRHSLVRKHDGSFIHNYDAFVKESGGSVIGRRWEGDRVIDGHTIYFVFAGKDLSRTAAG